MTVSITADGYGSFANVVETLPGGFSYESVSGLPNDQVSTNGQEVTFSLLGQSAPHTFSYTVTAPDEAGSHSFSGVYSGVDGNFDAFADVQVGGDSAITVEAAAVTGPMAVRSISSDPVNPGDSVPVTITAEDFGSFAEIVETVPAGFTYDSVTGLDAADVDVDGREITFTLLGETAPKVFTYNVTAPDVAGSHTFSGTYLGVDASFDAFASRPVGGTTSVTVEIPVPVGPKATRSMASRVDPGGSLTVSIAAEGQGSFANVAETLPGGFSYGSSSLPDDQVSADGQTITFSLLTAADATFTYTVTAPDATGSHTFSGVYSGVDDEFDAFADLQVVGDSRITVGAAPPPEPTPDPTPDTTAPTVSWNAPSSLTVNEKIRPVRPATSDEDIASYTITDGKLPNGLRLNSDTGVITGRPTQETSSSATVTIKACDTSGNCTSVEVRFPAVQFTGDYEPVPTPALPEVPEPDLSRITVGDATPSKALQIALASTAAALLLGGAGLVAVRRRARARR